MALTLALLVLATSLLSAAATVLLLRATLLRRVRADVATVAKATVEATLKQAVDQLQGELKSAVDSLTQLRSERGRVMALLRHRGGRADPDGDGDDDDAEPDRLDALLANPIAQGFLQAKGLDPSMLAAAADGDPMALMALQQRAAQQQGGGGDEAGLLG